LTAEEVPRRVGSANILREPDDALPVHRPGPAPGARRPASGSAFLPFEDERLSLILSKAFLLAADTRITDRTILDRIGRVTRSRGHPA
jgi:hypothetical protein